VDDNNNGTDKNHVMLFISGIANCSPIKQTSSNDYCQFSKIPTFNSSSYIT